MRPRNIIPTYRLHQATGQARCVVNGKTFYLGPYDTPESRREYARILTELAAGNGVVSYPDSRDVQRRAGNCHVRFRL